MSEMPPFSVGQNVKMINCPDGDYTPDRLWTIRDGPFFFEGEWRVLLKGWIGAVPVANIVSADETFVETFLELVNSTPDLFQIFDSICGVFKPFSISIGGRNN